MKKRLIIVIGIIFVLIVSLVIFFMPRDEAIAEQISVNDVENSVKKYGITQIGKFEEQRYKDLILEVYFDNYSCLPTIKNVSKRFSNVLIRKEAINRIDLGEDIEFPLVILKGKTDDNRYILSGFGACSGEILAYHICNLKEDRPEFCNEFGFRKEIKENNVSLKPVDDKECYECCLIRHKVNNDTISRYWCGPPCKRIGEYVEGISSIVAKRCLEKSCKSDESDIACCNISNCVDKNKCYNLFDVHDVDKDNQKEVCLLYDNNSFWSDPDQSNESCTKAGFNWFSEENGFCCGDEENESFIESKGIFYNKDDFACCNKSQCVYKNECYSAGCFGLTKDNETKNVYCDGSTNRWVDLDEDYCEDCLGEGAWSGSVCCGDDEGEGKHYNEFIFYSNKTLTNTGYYFCVNDTSSCGFPRADREFKNGCYFFSDSEAHLKGGYYCDKGIWYDLDNSEYYCSICGFNWLFNENRCCRDDDNEYYIKGKDGTVACCELGTSCVANGKCEVCELCGNNVLDETEQCELPNSTNNKYCNQTTKKCLLGKIGIRDEFGDCNKACGCVYDEFRYSCIKGECDAECNSNKTGCVKDEFCNLTDCRCYSYISMPKKDIYGNYSKDCPYRVALDFNDDKYYVNDEVTIIITVYNKDNKIIPNVRFYLDVLKGDEIIGTAAYSTGYKGSYTIKKRITKSTESGVYKYIVRAYMKDCDIIGNTGVVEFVVEKEITPKTTIRPSKKITRRVKDTIPPNLTEPFEAGMCGNGIVELGEVCEGNNICRALAGCDYSKQRYDIAEYCNNCDCGVDVWSERSGELYCNNCEHCGDGVVNCNEICENNNISRGLICRNGDLYEQIDICYNCDWYDDDVGSDILIDNCYCDCPENPKENCVDGNYMIYLEDYYAGCSNAECNDCLCSDMYSKDVNDDAVEDKCGIEFCGNNLDDDDNGFIDESGCIWYYCSDCGRGLFNLCTRDSCSIFEEGCFFEEMILGYGSCMSCLLLGMCEDYGYDKYNCINDPCDLGGCFLDNVRCCTDADKDNVCDYEDNCIDIFNPLQRDNDGDGKGDLCEICDKEAKLFFPLSKNESICDDKIDDDCDYLVDCDDNDCYAICLNITKGAFNESK